MVANSQLSVSDAFSNDVVNSLMREGGNAESAFGNDTAASFNLGSGLSKWFASMSGGVRNNVVVIGDSNVQDVPAETWRWPNQLQTDLIAFTGIATGGEGFRHAGLPEFTSTGTPVVTGITPGFFPVETPFTATAADIGVNGYGWVLGGTGDVFTWTLPAPFGAHDRFVLYGQDDDFLVQQPQYSLNGGAFTDTAYNYAPTLGNRLVKQEIVGTVASTLRYRGSATTFPSYLNGMAFYQGTTGLIVHNLGVGGNTAYQTSGLGASNRLAIIDDLAPKLTVIWLGTNDFHHFPPQFTQKSPDYFYTNYLKIVQRARLYGDVLMVYPQASQIPNPFSTLPIPKQQRDYERVLRKIAYDTDSAYISIHQLWGDWTRHNARGFAADSYHITQAGHNVVSKYLTRAIRRVS